ncbi:MAG: hypothetical protein WCG08_11350 [Paludibacter sp.]
MNDFTLKIYQKLLQALLNAGYTFYTFESWCEKKAVGKFVILRHDVDLKAGHSLATAQLEAKLGIVASYYFRVVPQSNQPEIIKAIAFLGHEIGYHYEDLSICKGNLEESLAHFRKQLAHFRQFYPVRTICMHGSPTSKWDNRELWKTNNYRDYGIIGEPYFDFLTVKSHKGDLAKVPVYLTDTGRMWDGDKYNIRDKVTASIPNTKADVKPEIHTTFDFIEWLAKGNNSNTLMITTHPQRWTDKPIEWITEYVAQHLKNLVKRLITLGS